MTERSIRAIPFTHRHDVLEPEQVEHLPDPVSRVAQPVQPRVEVQVLPDGQVVVQIRLVPDGTDEPSHLARLSGHLEATAAYLPGCGTRQRRKHPEERRLSGPVRPEDADALASVDSQRDVVQRQAISVPLGQASGLDRRGGQGGCRGTWGSLCPGYIATGYGHHEDVLTDPGSGRTSRASSRR